ncbi:NAD(P)/FAD-dependent oxidoreductase [Pseudoroseicyclus tamaricis]|uniref:FAD-binding oxidoreductase n=1 Tax=Pseudoroseicyclus tamaricis TaxID=2705421 RepID=A0A6B2JIK7_9RHOB|nr:FAD-dependent oxidoreductase [Pseudoroseicyclus tamaricis]NDV01211.1 FAD-binding oxidoreductase [Pseudoroseicyclus tamaricis]
MSDPAADFPYSLAAPPEYAGPLPEGADVAIIGGGIIGICTALFLARAGLRPVVLEKGRVAAEQSSRNWGWIRTQGRDPAELPIAMEARRLWAELARQSGEDIGLRQSPVTYLARKARELEDFAEFAALAKAHGLDTRLLDAAETRAFMPGMSRGYLGAMTTPSDMRAEPWLAVRALARLAVREGAVIREHCAARGLDMAAGRVAGVWTEAGLLRADAVLVAGGAWSSLLLRAHGVTIPQLAVRATVAATVPLPLVHDGAATDEHIAFRRRQDGGYTLAPGGLARLALGPDALRHARHYLPALRASPFGIGYGPAAPAGYPDGWRTPRRWEMDEQSPFERMRILDPLPEARRVRSMTAAFGRLYPALGEVKLHKAWAGMIDAMPDIVPVVDHVEGLPGLTVATGMSAHGFGIGPGFGRVTADLIRGAASVHDLTRFRLSRFSDGSRLELGPAL